MSSTFVYKDVKTTPLNKKHIAHKEWTITDETATNFGIVSYSGQYSNGEFYISDPSSSNVALEPLTSNNYYKRTIFNSIHSNYYTDIESFAKSKDNEYLGQQIRTLNQKFINLSIPSGIFGQRIKEGSFSMSHASYATLRDDGTGNIIDQNVTNLSNFKRLNKSDYIIKVDFNDGWKFLKGNPATDTTFRTGTLNLSDISDGPFEPIGENITFGIHKLTPDGLATTQIVFKSGAGASGATVTVTITDAAGVSKTYISDGTSEGALNGSAQVGFNGSAGGAAIKAASLKAAIDSANGHNGSITTEIITAGGTTGDTVKLTQTIAGVSGNTNLTAGSSTFTNLLDVDVTTTPFTGGGFLPIILSGSFGVEDSTFLKMHGSHSINSESNSFVRIDRTAILNNERRWNDSYSVSFWLNAPPSQSVTSSFTGPFEPTNTNVGEYSFRTLETSDNNVIATSRGNSNDIPWEIQLFNRSSSDKGKIKFIRGKKENYTEITSSAALNDGEWHHIVAQVDASDSTMQLYVDGALQVASKTDPMANELIPGRGDIHIGARQSGFKSRQFFGLVNEPITSNTGAILTGQRQRRVYNNRAKNYINPYSGSLDKFKIVNRALTSAEISSLYNYYRDTDIVGNVFYNHGMAVITDPSGSYTSLINDYTLKFKATTEHTIHNYQCIIEDEEYNFTFNPSVRKNQDKNNDRLQGFATASTFAPYITTIGLYNEFNELLAIGKLANPVKSPQELDLVINVQFDT